MADKSSTHKSILALKETYAIIAAEAERLSVEKGVKISVPVALKFITEEWKRLKGPA